MSYGLTRYKGFEFSFLAMVLLALCAGCGTTYPPVAEDQRNYSPDYDYVIGAGDTLEIFVWGNEELTTTGVVRPDGKFTTRLIEDIDASGKTSSQLARDIEAAYSKYVRSAVVSVIVNGFVGIPEQQVRVVGEAQEPRTIPYRKHMTLLDLMIDVGGMTDFAAGNKAVLVRDFRGRRGSFRVRLDDLIRDGDISENVTLFPGDIVIIPESWF
jgi:polysaccharide export outer membrane protein